MTTCIVLLIGIILGMPLGTAVYVLLLEHKKGGASDG